MIEIDSETPIFGPSKTKKSQVDTKIAFACIMRRKL